MSNPETAALLDACLAADEGTALSLIERGQGLRHYCPRRAVEPLAACARMGLAQAFDALLDKGYFEPYGGALDEAFGEAVAHGWTALAMRCWEIGADLDYTSIEQAVSRGHMEHLGALLERGALGSHSGKGAAGLDQLFAACCSHGLDEDAARCVRQGALLDGSEGAQRAQDVAEARMGACAEEWLRRAEPPTPKTRRLWEEAFPALMLAKREALALGQQLAPEADGARISTRARGARL